MLSPTMSKTHNTKKNSLFGDMLKSETHSKSQLRQTHTFETKLSLRSFLSHHLKTNSSDMIMSKTLLNHNFKTHSKS